MDKQIQRRRGGPRTFDRDQALETAMRLFWRHGYEGVTLNHLTAAIGVAPPSLYSAFGSKAGIYREALDRYSALPGALDGMKEASTLDDAVVGLFREAIRAATASDDERGCMVSSGMTESSAENAELAHEVAERRRHISKGIALVLSRWLDPGMADNLATYFSAVLQGISVQARDGANLEQLNSIAEQAIAGFRARQYGNNVVRRTHRKRS
jgi:AcrR family transcriptional regulator